MYKKTLLSVAIASAISLTGCLDRADNENEKHQENAGVKTNPPALTQTEIEQIVQSQGTFPLFNPATAEMPIPNDILAAGSTDGTYGVSAALKALDYLDGTSPSAPYDIEFDGSLDTGNDFLGNPNIDGRAFVDRGDGYLIPNPNQNVFLLDLTYAGGDELLSAKAETAGVELTEVPTFEAGYLYTVYQKTVEGVSAQVAAAAPTLTAAQVLATALANDAVISAAKNLSDNTSYKVEVASTNGGTDNLLRILPTKPLNPESKYIVVVTNEILDSDGEAIQGSPTYKSLRDSSQPLASGSLGAVRDAIQGWETLASGWFAAATNKAREGVVAQTQANTGLDDNTKAAIIAHYPAMDADNVAISLTFTTAGTDTVLNAMAAPETFFVKKAMIDAKQAGIEKLFEGEINFLASDGTPTNQLDGFFQALVTTESAPTYISTIADGTFTSYLQMAGAFSQGSTSVTATHLHLAQTAAALANLAVVNGDAAPGLNPGDAGYGSNIAQTAVVTALTLNTAYGQDTGINSPVDGSDILGAGAFLHRPASGISDFGNENNVTPGSITFHDIFLPIGLTGAPTGTLADYRIASSGLGLPNPGYIMQGQIDLPYFLPDASEDPLALHTGTWVANDHPALSAPTDKVTYRMPFAKEQSKQRAPFVLSTPNDALVTKPENGWPVVIFQHGILGARGHSLPAANGFGAACLGTGNAANAESAKNTAGPDATRCFATIAIDMPLHGVAPNTVTGDRDPFLALSVDVDPNNSLEARDWSGSHYEGLHERHFNYTKVDATGTPGAMTYGATAESSAGSSGEFYINLGQPAGSRDNLRQSVVDLMTLTASLGDIDLDGDPDTQDLDTSRVYFVGHSLGGIVGTTYVATNNNPSVQTFTSALPDLKAVSLTTTGGQITRILENSPALGGAILAGLNAASGGILVQGNLSLEKFLNTSQAAIASADSVNFAAAVGDLDLPVLATEIYGDGSNQDSQDDTIVIGADSGDGDYFNPRGNALNSPLVGTEPLISELGLTALTPGFTEPGGNVNGVVRFNAGSHLSIITGAISGDNTEALVQGEMVTQMISFFSSQGQEVAVGTAPNQTNAAAAVISTDTPDISN